MSPMAGTMGSFGGFNTARKERFGGEENDGNNDGPIMQKRFKRTTAHFFAWEMEHKATNYATTAATEKQGLIETTSLISMHI